MRRFLLSLKQSPTLSKAKRHWLTISFLLGFIVDNLTLNRVDQVFDNAVLLFYVVLACSSMLLLYAGTAFKLGERYSKKAVQYAPLILQYSFGGLLSGMLIFYGRAGSWAESWPFLLIILAAIYFNETIKDRVGRLLYNLTIFFIALFSYVVLIVPVVTGKMSSWMFVGSGALAAFLMYLFVQILYKIIPNFMTMHTRAIVFALGTVFVGFNFLYFTNVIPPIPLSAKHIGIYHSVVRFEDGTYQVKYEQPDWWQFWVRSDKEFHPVAGDNVFCFAQIFAPTRLATEVQHHWQWYNEAAKRWETYAELKYSIEGGRSDGYRGYTLIKNFKPGTWRCRVETIRGQVIGQETFEIVAGAREPLVTENL
jgi:hypothetical protein